LRQLFLETLDGTPHLLTTRGHPTRHSCNFGILAKSSIVASSTDDAEYVVRFKFCGTHRFGAYMALSWSEKSKGETGVSFISNSPHSIRV
jgi:hypothetical protein